MFSKNTTLTTIIGESSILTGDLVTKQSARIDGIITGNVTTGSAITVSTSGEVEGDLTCLTGKVTIEGKVIGNVTAEYVKITATGLITGRLIAQNLIIEDGAIINSTIKMNKEENKD